MDDTIQILVTVGGLLLAGLLVETVGQRTFLPRVTLLILLGIAVGGEGLDILGPKVVGWFDTIASVALVMIGFLLGERLTINAIRRFGKQVMSISLFASVGTSIVVGISLSVCGVSFSMAVLLAGIAAATDPAATIDVINEEKAQNPFTEKLIGVVALDDIWGLIVFSVCVSLALLTNGDANGGVAEGLWSAGREIGGAVLLGALLGLPVAFLSGRIEPGEPTLVEALGVVLVCGGLALWLEVSFLIAAMTMGMLVANLAKHHERPFHEIEGIEGPFLVLFFVLAGASLDLGSLSSVSVIVSVYIISRLLGKMIGGWAGAKVAGSEPATRRWIGVALVPQAGVAMGMALIAASRFPEFSDVILSVVIASTVVFEIAGPILTRVAVRRNAGT